MILTRKVLFLTQFFEKFPKFFDKLLVIRRFVGLTVPFLQLLLRFFVLLFGTFTGFRAYLRRWEAMELSWEQLGALDDEASGAIVYQESAPSADLGRWQALQTRLPAIVRELGRVGVTRWLLWEEYRREHPEGYGYPQFCQPLRAFRHHQK